MNVCLQAGVKPLLSWHGRLQVLQQGMQALPGAVQHRHPVVRRQLLLQPLLVRAPGARVPSPLASPASSAESGPAGLPRWVLQQEMHRHDLRATSLVACCQQGAGLSYKLLLSLAHQKGSGMPLLSNRGSRVARELVRDVGL